MLNDEHEGKPVINLIMKVSDEDWNVPVGQIAKSSMPLSRYLEYTMTDSRSSTEK